MMVNLKKLRVDIISRQPLLTQDIIEYRILEFLRIMVNLKKLRVDFLSPNPYLFDTSYIQDSRISRDDG